MHCIMDANKCNAKLVWMGVILAVVEQVLYFAIVNCRDKHQQTLQFLTELDQQIEFE